jgi:hypothetical protein
LPTVGKSRHAGAFISVNPSPILTIATLLYPADTPQQHVVFLEDSIKYLTYMKFIDAKKENIFFSEKKQKKMSLGPAIPLDELPAALDKLPSFYSRNHQRPVRGDVTIVWHEMSKLPIRIVPHEGVSFGNAEVIYSMVFICLGRYRTLKYGCESNSLGGDKSKLRFCRARLEICFTYDTEKREGFAHLREVGSHGPNFRANTEHCHHYTDKVQMNSVIERRLVDLPGVRKQRNKVRKQIREKAPQVNMKALTRKNNVLHRFEYQLGGDAKRPPLRLRERKK